VNIDEFVELARTRRSVRRFKPDPVPDEYIEKMLEAARWAQSGANAQPWEFIVVKNKGVKDKIVAFHEEHRRRAWAIEKTRIKELRHPAYTDGIKPGSPGFKNAPVFIVVCGDPRTIQASVLITHFLANEGGPGAHFLKGIGNTTQIIHLAAASLGLGTQWVSVNVCLEASLKKLLDVPDELAIHTIIPVGYPAIVPPASYRREREEFVHYEKYDQTKFRSGDDVYEYLVDLRLRSHPSYKHYIKEDKSKE